MANHMMNLKVTICVSVLGYMEKALPIVENIWCSFVIFHLFHYGKCIISLGYANRPVSYKLYSAIFLPFMYV